MASRAKRRQRLGRFQIQQKAMPLGQAVPTRGGDWGYLRQLSALLLQMEDGLVGAMGFGDEDEQWVAGWPKEMTDEWNRGRGQVGPVELPILDCVGETSKQKDGQEKQKRDDNVCWCIENDGGGVWIRADKNYVGAYGVWSGCEYYAAQSSRVRVRYKYSMKAAVTGTNRLLVTGYWLLATGDGLLRPRTSDRLRLGYGEKAGPKYSLLVH